ncbi:MAG: hypothetical protein UV00_C0015G0016 [candidate division WWE3 bacterium GW2011_GWF1_42_14]|uniref:Uncharacterized protein n=1 Tax=candidate division WWE3 bacterium GW2011_GWF1_42_14 TaxID=1619138 RepID=A0A0G0YKZ9_UNCKA|nr:MAG: hypothetical protein UV00_C0015G0016 [candidate division WWE3 bacterium GW2011_GWF1_42_14]
MDMSKGHIKRNGKYPPGTMENPVNFNGEAAGRSELLSDVEYNKGLFIRVERAVYQIKGCAQECSGRYRFSYAAKPIGFI